MKGFLFDENLPRRLRFQPFLPIVHARTLGISLSDQYLWDYAKANDLVVITKDADFAERAALYGPPPRVIHLRVGNLSRNELHLLLQRNWMRVEALLPESRLIEVHLDRIERYSANQ